MAANLDQLKIQVNGTFDRKATATDSPNGTHFLIKYNEFIEHIKTVIVPTVAEDVTSFEAKLSSAEALLNLNGQLDTIKTKIDQLLAGPAAPAPVDRTLPALWKQPPDTKSTLSVDKTTVTFVSGSTKAIADFELPGGRFYWEVKVQYATIQFVIIDASSLINVFTLPTTSYTDDSTIGFAFNSYTNSMKVFVNGVVRVENATISSPLVRFGAVCQDLTQSTNVQLITRPSDLAYAPPADYNLLFKSILKLRTPPVGQADYVDTAGGREVIRLLDTAGKPTIAEIAPTPPTCNSSISLAASQAIRIEPDPVFDFGSKDFTIEWRDIYSTISGSENYFSHYLMSTYTQDATEDRSLGWSISVTRSFGPVNIYIQGHDLSVNFSVPEGSYQPDVPHYVSITKKGSKIYLHIDGAFIQERSIIDTEFNGRYGLNVGRHYEDNLPVNISIQYHYIGALAITNGLAKFKANVNYIVPSNVTFYDDDNASTPSSDMGNGTPMGNSTILGN